MDTLFCLSSGLQTWMQLWWRRMSHGRAWMSIMKHSRQWTRERQRRSTVTSHPRWERELQGCSYPCNCRKTDAQMWLWTISEPHLRYLDVMQCHHYAVVALSSFNFEPESSNHTKMVSHGSIYFLHSNSKCVSTLWGSFPFPHESSPAKSVLPPE